MAEDTKYVGIRIPLSLYVRLKLIAKDRDTSLTEIAIESFQQYTDNKIPGLCPLCHIQNNPGAQYCQGCGTALNPDAQGRQMETLNNVIETLKQLDERMQVLEKKVSTR